jgi:hypothetical protein
MGTRSLICVFYKGRFVIAQYTQFDGYPQDQGQGMKILNFLLDPSNIERLKGGLQHVVTLSQESRQQLEDGVRQDIEARPRSPGPDVYFSKDTCNSEEFWLSLSPLTGAGILEIAAQATAEKPVPVDLALEFANDWLFCEWAYVVDLDDGVFEVFAAAEPKDKTVSKRFNDIGGKGDMVPALVHSFSFTQLPTTEDEFMGVLNRVMGGVEKHEESVKGRAAKRKMMSAKASL